LVALGVAPENVWAVEGNEQAFKRAAKALREAGKPIKLHLGSLHEFLSVVPEQFDIVYFDANSPLFGGKPKTSTVLRELFQHQRMAPLSILITNFAAKPRDTEEDWIKRFHAWYAPRYTPAIRKPPIFLADSQPQFAYLLRPKSAREGRSYLSMTNGWDVVPGHVIDCFPRPYFRSFLHPLAFVTEFVAS
jgi:hypothetical protein